MKLEEKLTIVVDYIYQNMKKEELDGFVDNNEVCTYLKINKRKLQLLRANGNIIYTQTGRKLFYKLHEVKRMIDENLLHCDPESFLVLVSINKKNSHKHLLDKHSNDREI